VKYSEVANLYGILYTWGVDMNKKKVAKKSESAFKRYNGSAVYVKMPKSSRSIEEICSEGSILAAGSSINGIINDIRK